MRRRYFFFDIDGTLAAGPIAHRFVPESTKRTLAELRRRGHFTAIATGRAHAMARPYMEELGLENMVCDGGAGLVVDGELLGIEPLERDACLRVLDECERLGVTWAFSPDDSRRRFTREPRYDELVRDSYMDTIVDPRLDYHDAPAFHKLYIVCTAEQERDIPSLAGVPTARFSPHVLFVEPVDKGAGIKRLMARLGAPERDVVVFGDGSNDVSMFLPEWTSIAMGNAIDELKARANYVTADADADGIMLACRHFGWID